MLSLHAVFTEIIIFLNMADINPVKSRRDQHLERLRTKYPDKKFEDDEEIFGQISDDYDQFEQENGAMKEREKAFSDMFTSNPKSARLMMEWKDGKDPVASLIRIYGKEDILAAIDDPAKVEALEEANKDFAKRVAQNREFEEQYDNNLPASLQAIEDWAQANGIEDGAVDSAVTTLSKICGDFILGKIETSTLEMIMKAQNHETDVENAREEGKVAGRNAKIVEKMRNSKKGDGIQNLNGRNNAGGGGAAKGPKSMFDWANEAM